VYTQAPFPHSCAQIFKELADSGVKVLIAGTTVGELALHYLNRNQILVLKVLSKFELRRLCRVVQATPLARLGAPTPEEAGYVGVCETIEIGGDRVTVLRQDTDGTGVKTRTATIMLRGATQNHLDDLERAVDDGVASLKALIKDPRLVPGAGATELALSRRVETYGAGLRGLAQHAVRRFASALEVIPRTLAENAHGGAEGNEIVARLLAKHEKAGGESWGVDVEVSLYSWSQTFLRQLNYFFYSPLFQAETDGTLNATEHEIVDSLAAKAWAIRLATEAAVSVLSVDSIIMSRPAGGPKIPQQAGNWDED
jgi:T-complex protein 1 subunit theta